MKLCAQRSVVVALVITSVMLLGLLDSQTALAQVPADDAWSTMRWDPTSVFTEAEIDRARDRALEHRALSLAGTVVGLAFYLAFLIGPLSPWLWKRASRAVESLGKPSILHRRMLGRVGTTMSRLFGEDWGASMLFVYSYLGLGVVVGLPFWIVSESLERRAGLSQYSTVEWIVDLVKGEAITWAGVSLLVFGMFGIVRRAPKWWWLMVGVPAAALLIIQGLVAPYETRLYHRVEPLEDEDLRAELVELANGSGLELSVIRVIEASRTTSRLNAALIGVGPTRELLLFDTLLDAADREAVIVAVAHELGHEGRRHTLTRYGLAGLALVAFLFMISRVLVSAPKRLSWQVPGDVRALPLVMLVASLIFLTARPARLALSRHEERLADRAALTMTADPEAFVRLQVLLARTNQTDLDPSQLEVFWFASHAPARERIGTALWYRDWLDRAR